MYSGSGTNGRPKSVYVTPENDVIININADRVLYSELPQTPPATPVSVRPLPLSLQELQPSRRRSASRLRAEFQKNTKANERKGERFKI